MLFSGEEDRDQFLAWYRERQAEEDYPFSVRDREKYAEALKQTLIGHWFSIDLPEYAGLVGQAVEVRDGMPLEPLIAVRLHEQGGHPARTVDVVAARLVPAEEPE